MPHIEVPIQAGYDTVLANMRRGYTADQYRALVQRIRERIPGVSIATDIIVGFPGETEEQFMRTYELLAELKLDVAHLARYSPRPGTVSARRMPDDVSDESGAASACSRSCRKASPPRSTPPTGTGVAGSV